MQKLSSPIHPFITISQDDVHHEQVLHRKLAEAGPMGFFYLEMSDDCKKLIQSAIAYANTFYKDETIRKLKLEGFSGFHVRTNSQVESLYLEQKYWQKHFSPELAELAIKMNAVATFLLKEMLTICQIPKEKWELVTGGVTEDKGMIHFTLNHYRPQEQRQGLQPHRDFNQVTVLFIKQKGLQARINEKWVDVPPLDDHFIINFGRTLETLVNNLQQLTAAWHRVQQVTQERFSLGIFADNRMDSDVYQRTDEGFVKTDTYREYIKKCFAESYEGD